MDQEKRLEINEAELNELIKEGLDGLRDDLTEANENIQIYYNAVINEAGGKELYGPSYNDALKIKGQARDRFLKLVALYKDRVTKKEDREDRKSEGTQNGAFSFNHSDLNDLVKDFNKEQENAINIDENEYSEFAEGDSEED